MAREFTWYGKTEAELKTLELQEFMKLIPSRERRSLKRGFTPAQKKLLKNIESGRPRIKTHCRDMIVIPAMLGKMLSVHKGKEWDTFTVMPEMLGHRLGEFALTRKAVSHSAAGVGATRSSKAVSAR